MPPWAIPVVIVIDMLKFYKSYPTASSRSPRQLTPTAELAGMVELTEPHVARAGLRPGAGARRPR